MGGHDQIQDIVHHGIGYGNPGNELSRLQQDGAVHQALYPGRLLSFRQGHDAPKLLPAGKLHQYLEQEAVQLSLRKRIGSLLFYGILCGQHQKRLLQHIAFRPHRHSVFLHGLQQGRLGLRRGAVDFIGQHQIGEDGAFLEAEGAFSFLLYHDIGSRHIAGHQVRGKLDALEGKQEHLAYGAHKHGLSKPRHALQQDISAGEQRQHHLPDDFFLTDDPLSYLPLTFPYFLLI